MNASKTPVVALTLTIDGVAIANFPASAINLDGLATLAANPVMAEAVAKAFGSAPAALPEPTTQDLVNFLHSDSRYVKRTPKAIQKFFEGFDEEFLKNLTGQAIAEGKVKRHIEYGSSLYSALAPAVTAPTVSVSVPVPDEAEAQPLGIVNLIDFLRSDSRFTQRSMTAIETKFGVAPARALLDAALAGSYIEPVAGRDQNFYAITSAGYETYPAIPVVAPETTTDTPDLEPEAVLNFLRSDPQYTKRSFEAVANHFTGTAETTLVGILRDLSNEGRVSVTIRRSDGAELYSANAPIESANAPIESATAAYAETPTEDAIKDFLRSDSRYSSRSFKAIQRHFNANEVDLKAVLDEMDDEGQLDRTTRRSDGEYLYSVA